MREYCDPLVLARVTTINRPGLHARVLDQNLRGEVRGRLLGVGPPDRQHGAAGLAAIKDVVPSATVQNVFNCVERAGLTVTGFVIKPLASALGALTPEESSAGAVSVDIGGGTCAIAIFSEGRPKHLAVIPVGGDHITNDVVIQTTIA